MKEELRCMECGQISSEFNEYNDDMICKTCNIKLNILDEIKKTEKIIKVITETKNKTRLTGQIDGLKIALTFLA